MGICVQDIDIMTGTSKGTEVMNYEELNEAHGWVWVVIRVDPVIHEPKKWHDWYIQGVASDRDVAETLCRDENYFIGPLPINTALPHDRTEWIGSYFPMRPNPT